jgi:hypothetical protein
MSMWRRCAKVSRATCRIALCDTLANTAFLSSENKVEKILASASVGPNETLFELKTRKIETRERPLTTSDRGSSDNPHSGVCGDLDIQGIDDVLEEEWHLYIQNLTRWSV